MAAFRDSARLAPHGWARVARSSCHRLERATGGGRPPPAALMAREAQGLRPLYGGVRAVAGPPRPPRLAGRPALAWPGWQASRHTGRKRPGASGETVPQPPIPEPTALGTITNF